MEIFEAIKTFLIKFDTAVFRFINTTLYNDFFAGIVKAAANDVFLAGIVFAGLFFLIRAGSRKDRVNVAFSLWSLILANIVSTHILKNIIKRPRPVIALEDVHFLVNMRYINYAFPSTHTAMAAALATVLWGDYKKARPYLALFTVCVGFFCIYTGGHWPLDVLAGLALGIIMGMIINIFKCRAVAPVRRSFNAGGCYGSTNKITTGLKDAEKK